MAKEGVADQRRAEGGLRGEGDFERVHGLAEGFELGEFVADVFAVQFEVVKAHFAVAARAGAAEAVPFEQFEAGEQGLAQGGIVAVKGFQGEFEAEFGACRDALGLARVFGGAGDAVDAVLAFGFGVEAVVVALFLGVGGVKWAVPEGKAGVADFLLEFFARFVVAGVAADAEELQDVFDGGLLGAFAAVVFFFAERFFLYGAAFPFEQATNFAFEAAAGDIGLAADGVLDDAVVNAADVDFAVARADVQAAFEDEVGGEDLDVL